ncbi:KUP system potassium uptake protein [Fluviicoccus keumensis]|uniref:Probable potassium transport system protein Kup n=1 Tax=Fluviicoccus keumensis TaxID=1435465 RepID=A0A4Q7Z421_9GAMM|nr:potassium transporter Kup [Fluviicoccus keumensis]RZU45060.1 KUP system potassium uptake protein [Fluviicoccus keumensis]
MTASTSRHRLPLLALTALGVVYGDIGTSPLYALKEVFAGAQHAVPITHAHILGVLSVIFWSLIGVVSLKYVSFVMRADNRGEGGIMALMALVLRGARDKPYAPVLMLAGLFGAALFYGDGAITPAISVLSAMEGLEIGTPAFKPYIVPLTIAVLALLFAFQKHGTARVGSLFGPVVVVWFATLGALGVNGIAANPEVLQALNPRHALGFFQAEPTIAFLSLGAVFLTLTGAEALYADMGHFGRKPVQLAWFGLVLPSLTLNYFGQGALLLANPAAIDNPFYRLAPEWAIYPLVGLATLATVIASQAVISGVYSITHQAMQLGYVPRVAVQHTSDREAGQIYLPGINWLLFLAVVALVLGFESSTRLAAAYGIAVCGTMIITTLLTFVVMRHIWGWGLAASLLVSGLFMTVDLAFLAANITKIADGGWLPLVLGGGLFVLMTSWKRGQALLRARLDTEALPLADFIDQVADHVPTTVPGTAIFLTPQPAAAPHALLHSLKHYKSLHERIIILTVATLDIPYAAPQQPLTVERLNDRFYRVVIRHGFMEETDLPAILPLCSRQGLELDLMDCTFFLGRETLLPQRGSAMAYWRELLFAAMFRNAGNAAAHFHLPPNRVVEVGAQIAL